MENKVLTLLLLLCVQISPSIAYERHQEMLDCGMPDSETCRSEAESRAAMALHYAKWEKGLKVEGNRLRKKYPDSEVFIAKKGSGRRTIDYSVIPSMGYKHHVLTVHVIPLADVNGKKEKKATVDVWYTKALGRNQSLVKDQSSFEIKVRQRSFRRLKIGDFKTHSAVIYSLKGIRYKKEDDDFIGCNPPPRTYDDSIRRACP